MPQIRETLTYQFDELSDSAKDRARQWYREGDEFDLAAECVIEDAAAVAACFGLALRTRPVTLMGGGTRDKPEVFYSGFGSQGDGACFEGAYSYRKGWRKALASHIGPQSEGDKEVWRIAEALADIQRKNFYALSASTRQRGHYQHSGCMEVSGSDSRGDEAEGKIIDELRSFADWIYRQLESEYKWRNADEQVDESIRVNEYEFNADGGRI